MAIELEQRDPSDIVNIVKDSLILDDVFKVFQKHNIDMRTSVAIGLELIWQGTVHVYREYDEKFQDEMLRELCEAFIKQRRDP